MIISASRRTDIPAFYGDWFVNRLLASEVLVRNPMNYKQVSRILLSPAHVECIVFWTKNPKDFLKHLPSIDKLGYKYYFLFTLNHYDDRLESGVAPKVEIIETFKRLSDMIGPEKVVWRYDPIIFSDLFDIKYHYTAFSYLAKELHSYSHRCIISFLDTYKKMEARLKSLMHHDPDNHMIDDIAKFLSDACDGLGFDLYTCSESVDLSNFGIKHSKCIDDDIIAFVTGNKYYTKKDASQRDECGCIESKDIGSYNTCAHECLYCYANDNPSKAQLNCKYYDPESPLLCDFLRGDEKITTYKMKPLPKKTTQINLF